MCRMCSFDGSAEEDQHRAFLDRIAWCMTYGGPVCDTKHECLKGERKFLMKLRDGAFHEYFCPECRFYTRFIVAEGPVRVAA